MLGADRLGETEGRVAARGAMRVGAGVVREGAFIGGRGAGRGAGVGENLGGGEGRGVGASRGEGDGVGLRCGFTDGDRGAGVGLGRACGKLGRGVIRRSTEPGAEGLTGRAEFGRVWLGRGIAARGCVAPTRGVAVVRPVAPKRPPGTGFAAAIARGWCSARGAAVAGMRLSRVDGPRTYDEKLRRPAGVAA